ncbi:MAG: CocE/NonD family hydrolase [Terriglobales bacterium]
MAVFSRGCSVLRFARQSFGLLLAVSAASSGIAAAQTGHAPAGAPAPRYSVRVERDRMVPMRDGVRLATDLYFPVGVDGKLPVILILTPYNKLAVEDVARMWAGQGYIAAVEDLRGKFASEGTFTFSLNDPNDGADSVIWAASQPWSTGKVGTYGCSYLGGDQIELSKLQVPQHTAMIPQAAGGAYRFGNLTEGGALNLDIIAGWMRQNGSKLPHSGQDPQPLDPARLSVLPVVDVLKGTGPPTDFEDWASHDLDDPWWDRLGYVDSRHHFNVPAIHLSSWNDREVSGTLHFFELYRKNSTTATARDNQYLIISPMEHCQSEKATQHTVVLGRDMGDARFDYYELYLRWFDHWLKGINNGVTDMPKVRVYVMGANRWRTADEWPLPGTRFTKYFFHSGGSANTGSGDGVLSTREPGREKPDRFIYDPMNPVPMSQNRVDEVEILKRPDVLVYTTPALEKPVEVTGPLQAVLSVSSSARDTDFIVRLLDVAADGKAFPLARAVLRARYREGFNQKVWMSPGKTYRLAIDLHGTGNQFAAGHRIRVEVSSSAFPTYARNLNTGGDNNRDTKSVVAETQIHHSAGQTSYVLLPIIP